MGNKARGCDRETNIAQGRRPSAISSAIFGSRPHSSALFPVVHEKTRCFNFLMYESEVASMKVDIWSILGRQV